MAIPRKQGSPCGTSVQRKWLPFVDDIRTALFENAEEIREMIPGLRCAGLIPAD